MVCFLCPASPLPQQTGHKRQARLHRSAVRSADVPLARSKYPAYSRFSTIRRISTAVGTDATGADQQSSRYSFRKENLAQSIPSTQGLAPCHPSYITAIDTDRSRPTEQSLSISQKEYCGKSNIYNKPFFPSFLGLCTSKVLVEALFFTKNDTVLVCRMALTEAAPPL